MLPFAQAAIRKDALRENALVLADAQEEQADKDDIRGLEREFIAPLLLVQSAEHGFLHEGGPEHVVVMYFNLFAIRLPERGLSLMPGEGSIAVAFQGVAEFLQAVVPLRPRPRRFFIVRELAGAGGVDGFERPLEQFSRRKKGTGVAL